MLVEDVMTATVVTVDPATSVKEALELLDHHRVTSLPVVEGRRLCGVVSEADLIRDLVRHDPRTHLRPAEDHPAPISVTEVMTRHPVTVHPATDLAVAVKLLTSTAVKSLPVVDADGHLLGVVSRSDVVRRYARSDDVLADEVRAALLPAGLGDWMVDVRDGLAELDATHARPGPGDRVLARVLTSSVPGIVGVRTT